MLPASASFWLVLALAAIAVGLMLRIAVSDFLTLKIRNAEVAALTALALPLAALAPGEGFWADLGAGGLLFALGILFWLLRMMGAGDAKLGLPLGVLVGWNGLLLYALVLTPASLLLMLAVKLGPLLLPKGARLTARLRHIAEKRTYPYGVPMVLAALTAILASRF